MSRRPYDSEGDDARVAMDADYETAWESFAARLNGSDARHILQALADAEALIAAVNMKAAQFRTRRLHDAAKMTVGTALQIIRQKGPP
jgi:hypothetical protein